MIEKLEAINDVVLVIREKAETEKGGLVIPDAAKKKPHRAKIISVGAMVIDKKVKVGKIAVFNQHSGFPLDFPDGEVYVLRCGQLASEIIAVL